MVVVVIGKSRQGFLLNVEAKYVQQSFLFDLEDFFCYTERVVDRLPLMTYGLKLNLEA